MKKTSVFVAVAIACVASSIHAQSGNKTSLSGSNAGEVPGVYVETVNRTDVSIGAKTYFTGLSSTEDGPNRCAGSLISPIHVLTSSVCMRRDIRWASVGAHYNNGTKDGEKIKIVAMLTHPKFADLSNDFMVLELESPSSHEPVALAAADGSDITVGEWGDVIGWKFIAGNGTTPSRRANELQSAKVRLMSSEECSTMMHIDDTMVCSGGLANEDPCQGAIGSPLIVERSRGGQSGQDVVVGVVSWGKDCNLANTPSVLARFKWPHLDRRCNW